MKELVSVIIPVYNAEKYIEKTLYSIGSQTYADIEIVVVDDGSTDNSLNVIKTVLEHFTCRSRIISQVNSGVSSARNNGIRTATGSWVIAIDADDSLEKNAIEVMVGAAVCDDVVFANYKNVNQTYEPVLVHAIDIKKLDGKTAITDFFERKKRFIAPATLIKKEFLIREGIQYDEECRFAEDDLFVWKILARVNSVTYVENELYNYYLHPNSTMTSSDWKKILTVRTPTERTEMCFIKRSPNAICISNSFLIRHYVGCLHSAALIMSLRDYMNLYNGLGFIEEYDKRIKMDKVKPAVLSWLMRFSPVLLYYAFRIKNR